MEGAGIIHLWPGHFANAWLNLGESGVVAFFFVSGFVIPLSLEKWKNITHFWINRAFRIYPMYLAVFLIGIGVYLASGHSIPNMPLTLIGHVFFVQEFLHTPNFIGVAWTLSLEAVWYLLFSVLFWLGWNGRNGLVSVLAMAAALAACVLSLFVLRLPMGRVGLLLVCVLGLLCLRREYGQISRVAFWSFGGAIIAVIVLGLFVGFELRPNPLSRLSISLRCVLTSWTLGAAIFFSAYFCRSCILFKNRLVRYLGKISYSIYLLHATVIHLVTPVFKNVPGGAYLTLAVVAIATIALAGLTYRFIEWPAIRLSHVLRLPKLREHMVG